MHSIFFGGFSDPSIVHRFIVKIPDVYVCEQVQGPVLQQLRTNLPNVFLYHALIQKILGSDLYSQYFFLEA